MDYIPVTRGEYKALLGEATRLSTIRQRLADEADESYTRIGDILSIAGEFKLPDEAKEPDVVSIPRSEYRQLIKIKTLVGVWMKACRTFYDFDEFMAEVLKDASGDLRD